MEAGYVEGDRGVFWFDQMQADAIEKLRTADGFFLMVVEDGKAKYVTGFEGDQNAAEFLAQAGMQATNLALQAMGLPVVLPGVNEEE